MRYSIDTSAILDGWRRYYPPDVIPALWERLEELVDNGSLRATQEVLNELERKDDEVLVWTRRRPDLFVPVDEEIQRAVTSILASHKKLIDTRASRSAADPFVIGLAQVNGCAVVTGESFSKSQKRPRIPDVCRALGIKSMSLMELMREERWVFRR